ncbi:uncharacterized protein LOC106707611 [Papilio machaon]|uniref:uncharacterized protein LOC106707611 n=1 Tax=Papilio machaon TaxID=76193 RepID=UPI001E6642D5|nr:uncharacterized protein LOC106707611 [Papilio machaon]
MKVLIFLFVVIASDVYGIPDYFPHCKKSDPQIEKCFLDAVETMRPKLKGGIPEVNIPALDPFTVPTLKLDRTASNLRLKANLRNMKAFGGSNFKIEKFKLNLNNKYLAEVRLSIPKLVVAGDYDVRGSRILTVDINGKGKIRGNFSRIYVVAKGLAKPIVKDNVEYLQADKIITKVKIGHGQIALEDSDSPAAATSAATFFNASPGVVLDILTPLIEETTAAVLKAFLNKILGSIPVKDILTDETNAS